MLLHRSSTACTGPANHALPRHGLKWGERFAWLLSPSAISTVTVKMECEREDSWFISVAPTDRFLLPTCPAEPTESNAWGRLV
jgi:hypothetical protein